MVKKSKKVLAMVLALTMITSVFAGTGAFATQPTGTNAPYKASIETNFYTKDANGVRTKVDNTNNQVATVTYYKAGTTEEVQKNALVVGDAYTVDIIQNQNQVKAYGINKKANLLVDLDSDTGEKYLDSTNIELVEDTGYTSGIKYTETFEAMTSSKLGNGVMELAIDVVEVPKKATKEYAVIRNTVKDGTTDAATFEPASQKTTFTDIDTDDVYFNLKTASSDDSSAYQYSVTATPTLVLYGEGGQSEVISVDGVNVNATADFKDGVNRCKLANADLQAALQKALAANKTVKSFSLTASVTKNTTANTVTFAKASDWEGQSASSMSKLPGAVVTLKYTPAELQTGAVFKGFTAVKTGTSESVELQQFVNENSVSFVMPKENITITAATSPLTAPKLVSLSNKESAKAKIVLPAGADSITITEGETKAIEVAPADNSQKFINYLNTDVPITLTGYTFKYTGMIAEKGTLGFDVSINASAVNANFPSDQLKDKLIPTNTGGILVPVCYDQKVTNNNANVKMTSIGDHGKLLTGQTNPTSDNVVKITYSADKVALYKATLGPDKEFDIHKGDSGKATATINYADVKLDILNLISLNPNEGVVKFDINNRSAGEVQLFDENQKPLDHNVAELGKKVNVVINVNNGCEFVAASAYKNGEQTKSLPLTDDSKEGETNIKRFSFTMPVRESEEDIVSATIVVELKKSVNLVNETSEDQVDTNHGYIEGIDGAVMTGDTVTFQALPETGSKYVPSEVKVDAFKNGEEKVTTINVERDMPGSVLWGYKFTVPTDLDADEIKVSAIFKEGVLIENGTPLGEVKDNHGYIDGLEGAAIAGRPVIFQAKPDKGYTTDKDQINVKAYKGDKEIDALFDVEPYMPGSVFYGYQFTVPEGLNADVIKVSSTFEEGIPIVNETPEDKKGDNHGYIKLSDDKATVAPGDTVTFQAFPETGSKYMPSEINVRAYKNGEEKVTPINVERNMPGSVLWGYKFTVPADLDADKIKISATFEEGVLFENGTPLEEVKDNHGYINGLEEGAVLGKTVKFEALPEKDSTYVPDVVTAVAYKDNGKVDTDIKVTSNDKIGWEYQFTVPENLDADKIEVNATFKEGILVVNEIPKEKAADNHGYIPELVKATKAGKTIRFQALPTYNEIYIPKDVIGVAFKGGEKIKELTAEEFKPAPGEPGLPFYTYDLSVPADLDADEIKVSATFEINPLFKNAWNQLENGNWIYIKDGELVTGWFKDGGSDWFYSDVKTGYLKTGWFQDGGSKWYYSFTKEDAARGNREGAMASNQWVETNGEWYYLSADGYMETSKWVRTGNDKPWSYVDADGKAVKDTVVDGYYVDASGYCYDNM